jgi:hypothetical protein
VDIPGYVKIVIVIDEGEMADREIDRERGDGEQKCEQDGLSF